MTDGERDPALPRVNAALSVGWMLGRHVGFAEGMAGMTDGERFLRRQAVEQAYDRGFADGVAAAKEEDDRRFRERDPIYLGSTLINAPTAAEREAKRESIIREAHYAGLHDENTRGCYRCDGRKRLGLLPCPRPAAHMESEYRDAASQSAHNGDYGVVVQGANYCASCRRDEGKPHASWCTVTPEKICQNKLHSHKPGDAWLFSCATPQCGIPEHQPRERSGPVPSPGKCGNGWLENQGMAVADGSHVHLCLTLRAQPHVCTCSRCR
jgi:hypothetical protein